MTDRSRRSSLIDLVERVPPRRSAADEGARGPVGRREEMIRTLLDACRFILNDQGEAQSSDWPASQAEEMRLWRASEAEVRRALDKDIEEHGESSLFVK